MILEKSIYADQILNSHEIHEKNMKKGDIVYSSGFGKTSGWKQTRGTITRVDKKKFYVNWKNTKFEDELESYEILLFDPSQILKFSDGVEIFTGGPYRIITEPDGLYVTGMGKLHYVNSIQEGEEIIHQIKENEKTNPPNPINSNIISVSVSLGELIQLNTISIKNNYNRNLVDDFHTGFDKNSRFDITPVMIHEFRNGHKCEPHIRYLIYSMSDIKSQLFGIIDLPYTSVQDLLA